MRSQLKKLFRSVQVYFPFLQDYRFELQRSVRNLLHRVHDPDFEGLPYLPQTANNLFIDVGANRGEAIQSILLKRPDAKVIAFEPNSHMTEKVRRIYRNDDRVQVHNVGLGSSNGTFDLFIPYYKDYMFDGLASFKERRARRWLQNRLYCYHSASLVVKKIVCQVKRLDDFKLNPYFIKIDVQGFEYDVLLGAKNTLVVSRPIVLIETPDCRETDFLVSLGYRPYIYKNAKLVAGTSGVNVFFIDKSSWCQKPPRDVLQ